MNKNNMQLIENTKLSWVRFYSDERRIQSKSPDVIDKKQAKY